MQWMKTLKSGIQNGMCSPLAKKKKTQKPEIPENLLQYSAERTYDTLYLINHFNDNNPWFRAYITNIKNKDYLELHYTAICLKDEQEVMSTFAYLMNDLLNEDTLKLLTPILNAENI